MLLFTNMHGFDHLFHRYDKVSDPRSRPDSLTDVRDTFYMYRDLLDMFIIEHAGGKQKPRP